MGLNYIKVFDKKTDEYTSNLSKEIADKFEPLKKYGLIGFHINKYDDYYVSFKGKFYNYTVKRIVGKKYSLNVDLKAKELNILYLQFKTFLDENEEDKEKFEEIQKAFDTTLLKNIWLEYLIDEHIPSPNEIFGLRELFKLCVENNLILSYSHYINLY